MQLSPPTLTCPEPPRQRVVGHVRREHRDPRGGRQGSAGKRAIGLEGDVAILAAADARVTQPENPGVGVEAHPHGETRPLCQVWMTSPAARGGTSGGKYSRTAAAVKACWLFRGDAAHHPGKRPGGSSRRERRVDLLEVETGRKAAAVAQGDGARPQSPVRSVGLALRRKREQPGVKGEVARHGVAAFVATTAATPGAYPAIVAVTT